MVDAQKAQTTGPMRIAVRVDIGGGVVITAAITNEAIDELAIRAGDTAIAVIKASDVRLAEEEF